MSSRCKACCRYDLKVLQAESAVASAARRAARVATPNALAAVESSKAELVKTRSIAADHEKECAR